jgi:GNAT superfamily N-acetyltransferase
MLLHEQAVAGSRLGYTHRVTHAPVAIRPAHAGDLTEILHLFADDELRSAESEPMVVTNALLSALAEIEADPNNQVYVAVLGSAVVGTFQLTFIRQLSHGGSLVVRVGSVFVRASERSRGVGQSMMGFARAEAERRNAQQLQLTSKLRRERAHRFYERLGFGMTHKGMTLYLEPPHRERTTER